LSIRVLRLVGLNACPVTQGPCPAVIDRDYTVGIQGQDNLIDIPSAADTYPLASNICRNAFRVSVERITIPTSTALESDDAFADPERDAAKCWQARLDPIAKKARSRARSIKSAAHASRGRLMTITDPRNMRRSSHRLV
jgi:hypothetical protein